MAYNWYGYTSKAYPFGSVAGSGGLLPTKLPTKMIANCSYSVGPGEIVKIEVSQGKTAAGILQYMTILQESNPSGIGDVNQLDQEISLTNILPPLVSNWETIIKVSIHAEENTDPEFNASEPAQLFFYKNTATGAREVRVGGAAKAGSGVNAIGSAPALYSDQDPLQPLSGIQVQFFFRGTDIQVETVVSDRDGGVNPMLPPGSYDVRLYGGGFSPKDWLTGGSSISIGTSQLIDRFGTASDQIRQRAEFTQFRGHFASTRWVGYMVPEDFSDDREQFRNEATDPNYLFTNLLNQEFGRVFRGASYVDFVGLAIDPSPY